MLEIVTDKSQEGAQFVKGFGGIGGFSSLILFISTLLITLTPLKVFWGTEWILTWWSWKMDWRISIWMTIRLSANAYSGLTEIVCENLPTKSLPFFPKIFTSRSCSYQMAFLSPFFSVSSPKFCWWYRADVCLSLYVSFYSCMTAYFRRNGKRFDQPTTQLCTSFFESFSSWIGFGLTLLYSHSSLSLSLLPLIATMFLFVFFRSCKLLFYSLGHFGVGWKRHIDV